jgi:DNA-binding transcriptional LysR family regulator
MRFRRQAVRLQIRTAIMQGGARLQWGELQDFLAVARHRTLSSAAQALGVDATTIGRRLRKLEQRLGQTLFEHSREGHSLTESGEKLLLHVEDMERAALSIEHVASSGPALKGVVRISVAEGFGTWFMARHLPEFCVEYPGLIVELVANSGFLSPSKRETDIAILLARPRTGPVVSRKLSDYSLRLYASREYLRSALPIGTADDLREHRLIGYVPDLLYAPELRYLGEIDRMLEPTIRSSSINAQLQLIASGGGIGVLPDFIAGREEKLVPILPDRVITRSFWVVTHRDTRQLQRVSVVHTWLQGVVAQHRSTLIPATTR